MVGVTWTPDVLIIVTESILSFHKLFFEELKKPENFHPMGVATAFLKYSDYLKMYTNYIHGYSKAIDAFHHLMGYKKFSQFVQERSKEADCKYVGCALDTNW